MKSLGDILRETRLNLGLTLEEVARQTRIKKNFLEKLEANDWVNLPPQTYLAGFVKSYAKVLRLDEKKVMAVFRREYPPSAVSATWSKLLRPAVYFTPQIAIQSAVIVSFTAVIIYLGVVFLSTITGPRLRILTPVNNLTTKAAEIEIEGVADKEASFFINGQRVLLDQDGKFSTKLELLKGENRIEFLAKNKFGRVKRLIRTVNFQPK